MNETPSSTGPGMGDDRFQLRRLSAAENPEQFALHTAALEWSLDAPITIRGEADIQSKRSWEGRVTPYRHQIENLITFCRRAPVALLADDVGLGKTISAGLILSELTARRKVSRALVVAPRMLLAQWQEELASKFSIPAEVATGQSLAAALKRRIPAVITTYESLKNQREAIAEAQFDMAIFDEAHKMRNLHGTQKPPQLAVTVRGMLEQRFFKYVLMLTATPIQNRLWDLYSLIDLLTVAKGHVNPLGSPNAFGHAYIADDRATSLRETRRDEFRRHLGNYIVRTRRTDAKLMFPERNISTRKVTGTTIDHRLNELVQELATTENLNHLAQISISQALMSSPEALASQLEEMAARGTVPHGFAQRARAEVARGGSSAKIDGLMTVMREVATKRPDWRVVVFTRRIATQQAIGKRLEKEGIKCGYVTGGKASQNERWIAAFRKKVPEINALISTDAGAEGLNLQAANILINYDLPWNPMILEQRIGRIQRLGSSHAAVHVLNLVLANSLEEAIVARLLSKLQAITESIGDIEGILESIGNDFDGEAFEETIRKLVIASMQGADVARATQLMEDSIRDAKKIYDDEQKVVEQTLGDLRDMHFVGPKVPEIASVVPSIDAAPFVLRALRADGAAIEEQADGTHLVRMPGQHQFVLTFADDAAESSAGAVFSGNAPRAFIPGKRHFERLAQSWADKCGALFVDSTGFSQERLNDAVARWLRGQGTFELQSAMAMGRNEGFHGTLTWRASVAVEHDRLEKLVEVPVTLGPKLPPEEFESQVTCSKGELDLASLPAPERDAVAEAINRDPDLYKFVDFYGKRLAEELPNARTSALEQRVRQQFTHSFAAQTVSARGVKFAVVQVAARIGIDGHGPYETVLEFKPWRNDDCAVRPLEEWIPCAATGIAVPRSATDECSVTGQRALRHRLARSEESGRAGLPDRVVRCEATGAQILPDEAERCSVTGRLIRQSLMETSVISGTKAARSALVKCEFTNDWLLPSEAGTSDISGKKFRLDQAMRSAVSQRHGHASEFVASVSPTGWIARDEAARSSVSGEWAAAEAMRPSDRPPHRLGLPHEFVQCSVSGRSLLRDEAVISAVSGRVIDRELAVASASSGKFALPEEMVSCERSGRRLLPDEAVRCTVTGTLVDARDTAASGVSGKPALKELLLRCPETGKLMLPDEAVICAASGTRVLPATLGFCAVTQRRAVKRRMAACPSTGLSFIDDSISRNAVLASTGEFNVLQRCAWTGETVLGTQLRPCVISGIRVVPGQLNKDGELIALREMLDGAAPRGMRLMQTNEIEATMNALQERRSWHSGVILEGPGRAISVSVIRMKMGLFGLGSSFLAVALERGIPPRIAGRPTEGRRVGGIWKRDSAP